MLSGTTPRPPPLPGIIAVLALVASSTYAMVIDAIVPAEGPIDPSTRQLLADQRGREPGRLALLVGDVRDRLLQQETNRFLQATVRFLPDATGEGRRVIVAQSAIADYPGRDSSLRVGVLGDSGPERRFVFPGGSGDLTRGAPPAMIEAVQSLTEGRGSVRLLLQLGTAEEIRSDIEARRTILIADLSRAGVNNAQSVHYNRHYIEMSDAEFRNDIEREMRQTREMAERIFERNRPGQTFDVTRSHFVADPQRHANYFEALRDAHKLGLVRFWEAPPQIPGPGNASEAPARLAEALAEAMKGHESRGLTVAKAEIRPRRNSLGRIGAAIGEMWGQGKETPGSRGILERAMPRVRK